MRFRAWMGHLTIRSFFGNAVGDVRDTTFGYGHSQQTSGDLLGGRSIALHGEGERRVKYDRVRTGRPHPICERESRSQVTGGQTSRVATYCLAPTPMGRSASVGLAWVAVVCQVCPAALTVEWGASAVFRQAPLAELAWADLNQADSNQVCSDRAGSNRAAAVCPVVRTADSAASVCFRHSTRPAWADSG